MHRLGHRLKPLSHKPLLSNCTLYSFNLHCHLSYTPHPAETRYDNLLKSCNDLVSLEQIHSALITANLVTQSPHLCAQIIIKYGKYGDLKSARSLFECVSVCDEKPSSFLSNTMIRAYANGGYCVETMELFSLMRCSGVTSNSFTYPFVFKACASSSMVAQGKAVHADAMKKGFDSDMYVEAASVDMYAKCGYFTESRKIFDEMPVRDLVTWTGMITAYEQAEKPEEAIRLFQEMQRAGLMPDCVAVVSIGSAVGQLGDMKRALSVHGHAIRNLFVDEVWVGNSILAMYAKCGDMEKARMAFDMMDEKNAISWNSMLSGYTQNGQASEAVLLFDEMQDSGCEPSGVTALIMVSASAYLGCHSLGKKFHDLIIDRKIEIDKNLQNALMDMYAKCGDLETARKMFDGILQSERSTSACNVLISGYGMHGHGKEALELFSRMQEEGVEPNHITFTSVLSACSHAGLVYEGKKCFEVMQKLSVMPEAKHYACMVDMLGRAGFLEEAFSLIREMPLPPTDTVWGALLSACKIYGNAELGVIAADNLFQLAPDHTGYYVLMSNIYAASNKWQEVGKLRQGLKNKGLKKPAAFSVIEYGKDIHGFHTNDLVSPYRQEVFKKVEILATEMKRAGYVPDLSCVLHDVEDEDKEHILNYHSEKLAVAFGILHNNRGSPIRVTKNLRVCNDCHSAFKCISFLYCQKISVRDANRFHHFEYGKCSCNDYW